MKFYQKWQGRSVNRGSWFIANVPGNIQYDYAKANSFKDMQYACNFKQFNEIEDDTFEYKTALDFTANENERVFFVSGGIDYEYEIFINGKSIYYHEGMYSPIEIDITDIAKPNDELIVKIFPHPKSVGGKVGTRDEADQAVKPVLQYGWDFQPRLIVSGIWQETFIEVRNDDYVKCEMLPTRLSDDLSVGVIEFNIDCKKEYNIAIYDSKNNLVYTGTDTKIIIKNPLLWWCLGQGEQNLYRYEVSCGDYVVSGKFGFKKIRLVFNEGECDSPGYPKTRTAPPITIELNNRKIFAKGTNWVFPEIFTGTDTDELYKKQLKIVADTNFNILRVHGGAGMHKDIFYDLCDEYGIMVWQEFPLACNNYLDTEKYLSVLKIEATAMIKHLRTHASLIIWCGGNELFNSWSGMNDQSHVLRLLDKLCYEYDYDKPYLFTSPLYKMGHGDYRFYNVEDDVTVFEMFSSQNMTAYIEFGVGSASVLENIKRVIPSDELFPPTRTESWLAHHAFDAWKEDSHLYLSTLEKYFGKPNSIKDIVQNSLLLQSIGYQFIYEESRRQWPHCSMALNWCFNEPWMTAANNSLVCYPCTPKPALKAVKNALRPSLFSARTTKFSFDAGETFIAELWLLNDSQREVSGTVKAVLEIGDKQIELGEWSMTAPINANAKGPTITCVLPNENVNLFKLKLIAGDMSSEYQFHFVTKK